MFLQLTISHICLFCLLSNSCHFVYWQRKCQVEREGLPAHISQSQPVNTLVRLKGHLPYKSPHTYSSPLLFQSLLSESLSISFIPSFLSLNWRKPASSSHPHSSGLSSQLLSQPASSSSEEAELAPSDCKTPVWPSGKAK